MPFTSFTAKYSYSLTTHYVVFDHTNMYVKLRSDNSTVKTQALAGCIDMRANNGNFEIGTINGLNGSFNRYLDFTLTPAGIEFDDSTTKIIGSEDINSGGATKYNYIIGNANCPIRVQKNVSTSQVTITCPCDQSNCVGLNSSYSQTN